MKNIVTGVFFSFICIFFTQANPRVSTSLVISQIYGDGGTSGSTYANDFIEIYNGGSSSINLGNYSVQYSSGTSWTMTALTAVVLQPGTYYLIKEASNGAGGTPLQFFDVTGTISMHASNGKVALANTTSVLPNGCTSAAIIDLVGFGNANCFEGTAALGGTNVLSIIRKAGNVDTDNNSADFTTSTPTPRTASFVLPIIINNFSANKTQNINELHWQINCLSASVNFELQRSADAINFKNIYIENASKAKCASPFNFVDHQPMDGNNSYRLKVTDNGSNIYYSKIVSISNNRNNEGILSLIPTLITTRSTIKYLSYSDENIQWIITDIHGKQVNKFTTAVINGENYIPLNAGKLPIGQYQLQAYTSHGATAITKFVKE